MLCNFGGFVPLSTVDWRGRSVAVIFFRGCPARCFYCHNPAIATGIDQHPIATILDHVREARPFISGVVISGGEATAQPDALMQLCRECRELGLATGIHTNGMFPETVHRLIDRDLIDHIALDLKTTWDRYPAMTGMDPGPVQATLARCIDAYQSGYLKECEAVTTLFRGYEADVQTIATCLPDDLPYVVQQGVCRRIRPLTAAEIEQAVAPLTRSVLIRTRQAGQYEYHRTLVTDHDIRNS